MTADARIQLLKTAFVVYYHFDLSSAKRFLVDFGLTIALERPDEIFFQGYGTEPYIYVARKGNQGSSFGGAAYLVDSRDELIKAHQQFGATAPEVLNTPGGGEQVSLTDPMGHAVHLIWGWQEKASPEPTELEKLTVNYEDEKPRKGRFQRFQPGPAPVHRWGHYGVTYPEGTYQAMYDWYTTTLTLAPSDLVLRAETPVTCFFHVDRGLEYTDHHAFFIKPAKPSQPSTVAHAAFEVHDFDVQQLGHNFLDSRGYKICWVVGRHVLGSQVFDYWFDPSGFVVEHYADGDLVNAQTPIARVQAGPQALSIWGPPVPSVF